VIGVEHWKLGLRLGKNADFRGPFTPPERVDLH